jgi:hypothetical protein
MVKEVEHNMKYRRIEPPAFRSQVANFFRFMANDVIQAPFGDNQRKPIREAKP